MPPKPSHNPQVSDIAELAQAANLRRIHVLSWRDLADVEAGGSELHAAQVMKYWSEAGIEITARTSYAQGHPQVGTRDGYKIIRKHGRYMVFPTTILSEIRKKYGPSDGLVEIWNGVPFLTPLWYFGPRITLLHHIHKDMWHMVLEGKLADSGKFFESKIAPPLYKNSRIVTLSNSSKNEIVQLFKMKPQNVSVVPPGIDNQFTISKQQKKSPYPHIVSVGRLMPSKKFDTLIRLVQELKGKHPKLQLSIIGEGYEEPSLRQQIIDVNAQSWIHLRGHVSNEELIGLYQQAWVVASTSIAEGWGMTLTEAAACGTPCVATKIVGHSDAVLDKKSGLLAENDSEFIQYLDSIISDVTLQKTLQQGALEHARSFTWESTAYNVLRPLAQIASERRRFRTATS